GFSALVGLEHGLVFNLLTLQKFGVARILDFHSTQHLPNDDLDMLVVDTHTLQPVNILNFLDQIGGQFGNAAQAQNVMRHQFAFGDHFPTVDELAFKHTDLAPLGNQKIGVVAIHIDDLDALLALGAFTKAHGTGGFGENRRNLRL